jgi:hypothetical protein
MVLVVLFTIAELSIPYSPTTIYIITNLISPLPVDSPDNTGANLHHGSKLRTRNRYWLGLFLVFLLF